MFNSKKNKTYVASEIAGAGDETNSLVRRIDDSRHLIAWKYEEEDFAQGAVIIVHESQRALFLKNGKLEKILEPGEYELDPSKLPFLQSMISRFRGTVPCIHAQIYFADLTVRMATKWGCGDIQLREPKTGVPITIGVHGQMNYQLDPDHVDSFVREVMGTRGALDEMTLLSFFREKILAVVRNNLAAQISEKNVDLMDISRYQVELSDAMMPLVVGEMKKYGISVREFYIVNFNLDDENLRKLRDLASAPIEGMELDVQTGMKLKRLDAEEQIRLRQAAVDSKVKLQQQLADLESQRLDGLSKTEATRVEVERQKLLLEIRKAEAEADAYSRQVQGYTWQEEQGVSMEQKRMDAAVEVAEKGGEGFQKAVSERYMGAGSGGVIPGAPVNPMYGGYPAGMYGNGMYGNGMYGNGMYGNAMYGSQGWPQAAGMNGAGAGQNPPYGAGQNPSYGAGQNPSYGAGMNANPGQGYGGMYPNAGYPGAAGMPAWQQNMNGAEQGTPADADVWVCPGCGQNVFGGKFCNNCGAQRPTPQGQDSWTCSCGKINLGGRFCNGCGKPRG